MSEKADSSGAVELVTYTLLAIGLVTSQLAVYCAGGWRSGKALAAATGGLPSIASGLHMAWLDKRRQSRSALTLAEDPDAE